MMVGGDVEKTGAGENPTGAFQRAARMLLASRPGESNGSVHVAERAAQALEQLASHLSRLLGDMGVTMLLERSIAVAARQYPWLRGAPTNADRPESRTSVLRRAMEQQEPGPINDAFIEVMSIFVGLLKRLIGDGLVDRLLSEVWPAVFVPAAKDTP